MRNKEPNKIVLLNGPPGAGKTEALKNMTRHFEFQEIDPKRFLRAVLFSVFEPSLDERSTMMVTRNKETPMNCLNGMTFREGQIWASEKVIKPALGNDALGHYGVKEIKRRIESRIRASQRFVIDSVGFTDEAECYCRSFGYSNVLVLFIKRKGHDFSNDSRSWIDPLYMSGELRTAVIDNRFDKLLFLEQIKQALEGFVDIE
jgi:hypothetical protein